MDNSPILSLLGIFLTVCVPRTNVSRERHMGNRTKLQFRFSTDADARLMHSPSWETHTHTQGKLHFKTSSSVSIVINAEAKSFLKVFFTLQTNRTLDSGSTATVHRSKLQKCCCFFFWKVNVGQTQKTDMCVLHKNPVDTIFDEVLRCYISSMHVQHTSQTDFTSRRMKACRRTGCTSGSTTLSTSWQPVWALLGPSLLIIPKKLDNQCEMKVRVCVGGGLNLYTKKVGVETFSLSAVLLLTTSTSPSLNIAAASVNSLLVWPMSYLIL